MGGSLLGALAGQGLAIVISPVDVGDSIGLPAIVEAAAIVDVPAAVVANGEDRALLTRDVSGSSP